MAEKKILVVDDELITIKAVEAILHDAGYQTEAALSGQQAMDLLAQQHDHFSAALVDRMMVGIDGLRLVSHMKQMPHLKHIPVIMMTGAAEPDDYVDAIEAGVFDFIYKPMDKELLLFIINKALNHPVSQEAN